MLALMSRLAKHVHTGIEGALHILFAMYGDTARSCEVVTYFLAERTPRYV